MWGAAAKYLGRGTWAGQGHLGCHLRQGPGFSSTVSVIRVTPGLDPRQYAACTQPVCFSPAPFFRFWLVVLKPQSAN